MIIYPNEQRVIFTDFAQPAPDGHREFIKVRVVNWTGNRYYCQYITSNDFGGTCAFEKFTQD
ncbi:MAG: hypothetical protein JNK79_02655 [Chitinophagaceae bacterium]|nr:hypothetical protein [Chitinophagaceae bacterium]